MKVEIVLDDGRRISTGETEVMLPSQRSGSQTACLLYTSDAADDLLCVDLGGSRIIKKKNKLDFVTTILTTFPLIGY